MAEASTESLEDTTAIVASNENETDENDQKQSNDKVLEPSLDATSSLEIKTEKTVVDGINHTIKQPARGILISAGFR